MLILLALSLVTPIVAFLLYLLDKKTGFGAMKKPIKQFVYGIIFGILAILYSEIGFEVNGVVANIRDSAPLCAGFIFGGPAGIIAGIIGGLYRYFSVFWSAGAYTQIACSVATISAGFIGAICRKFMFDDKRPTLFYGVLLTLITEVLHMLLIFFTNMSGIYTAFSFVKSCTIPMVLSNVLAVFLALLVVSFVNRKQEVKLKKEKRHILETFQVGLSICVFLSLVFTILFNNALQKEISKSSTSYILKSSIDDVKDEIQHNSDKNLLNVTNDILDELSGAYSNATLEQLTSEYGVSIIHIVDEEGIIRYSSDAGYIDFDMKTGEQSREFMVLINGNKSEFVQAYGPTSINPDISMKYAGVKINGVGFIQVGYDANRFQSDIHDQVREAAKFRHVSQNGYIIICDESFKVISGIEGSESISLSQDNKNKSVQEYMLFEMKVQGVDSLCMFSQAEGYYIVSVIPVSEAIFTRELSNYISGFIIIVVFVALFINVYFLIKKIVVENLHKVNSSLSEITNGNLDVVVDVRENEEFDSLSNDINSTVDTLKRYIDEAAARIDEELKIAKLIQYSSLPGRIMENENFDINAEMFTAKEVGGDFYDYYFLDEHKVAFLVADVSGKGIPGAMFMMRAKTVIKNLAKSGLEIDEIFTRANEDLCKNNEADMFVTAWMGIMELDTGIVKYANAGHNPPLIKQGNEFVYLKSRPNFVLGGMENIKFTKNEIKLSKNDVLYLYTDGVTEATNKEKQLFGEDKLNVILNSNSKSNSSELCRIVKEEIDLFVGEAEQFDDITMLCLKYKKSGKSIKKSMKLKPQLEEMVKIEDFLTKELESRHALMKEINQFNIVIDEVFSNLVNYSGCKEIEVDIAISDDLIKLVFKDDGVKFNPLEETKEVDISVSSEEREIGGLGFHIVKTIMDEVSYEYKKNMNQLTIIKRR